MLGGQLHVYDSCYQKNMPNCLQGLSESTQEAIIGGNIIPSLGWQVTNCGMVGDHHLDGPSPSWVCYLTVLWLVGDHLWEVG